jgi:hypothetical protein
LNVSGSICLNTLRVHLANEGNVAVKKVEVYCQPKLNLENPERNITVFPGETVLLEFKASEVEDVPYIFGKEDLANH